MAESNSFLCPFEEKGIRTSCWALQGSSVPIFSSCFILVLFSFVKNYFAFLTLFVIFLGTTLLHYLYTFIFIFIFLFVFIFIFILFLIFLFPALLHLLTHQSCYTIQLHLIRPSLFYTAVNLTRQTL